MLPRLGAEADPCWRPSSPHWPRCCFICVSILSSFIINVILILMIVLSLSISTLCICIFIFFILIFPPSPGATDGRGQRLFRVSASQPSGVWSVVPSAGVPSPHVNIHCGGCFCSAELQRGCGHTNGGAGEGDQVREVLTVIHIFRQASFLTR